MPNIGDMVFFKPINHKDGVEREMVPAFVVEKHEHDKGALVLHILDQYAPSFTLVDPSDTPKQGFFCTSFTPLTKEQKTPKTVDPDEVKTKGDTFDKVTGLTSPEEAKKAESRDVEKEIVPAAATIKGTQAAAHDVGGPESKTLKK